MVYKKSVYVIDSISDTPTETVRAGSIVRLSNGKNEWILTDDWVSSAFYAQSYYSIAENTGIYQVSRTIASGYAFDIDFYYISNLQESESYAFIVNITSSIGTDSRSYMAILGNSIKTVLIGDESTHVEYSDLGVITIASTQAETDYDVKISVIRSSGGTYPIDQVSTDDNYALSATADTGMNETVESNTTSIATNASGISTNASGISTNASSMLTNASNIATNVIDIAANESDVAKVKTEHSITGRVGGSTGSKDLSSGGNWTVTRTATGTYTVAFTDGSLIAFVANTSTGTQTKIDVSISAGSAFLDIYDYSGVLTDASFSFFASLNT